MESIFLDIWSRNPIIHYAFSQIDMYEFKHAKPLLNKDWDLVFRIKKQTKFMCIKFFPIKSLKTHYYNLFPQTLYTNAVGLFIVYRYWVFMNVHIYA